MNGLTALKLLMNLSTMTSEQRKGYLKLVLDNEAARSELIDFIVDNVFNNVDFSKLNLKG